LQVKVVLPYNLAAVKESVGIGLGGPVLVTMEGIAEVAVVTEPFQVSVFDYEKSASDSWRIL